LAQTMLPSVLLVDDDCIAQTVFARQFGNGGWSVATAAGCAQAAQLFAVNVPDCLVVERDLEDGSGFSLFERLRAVNPSLAAIMITRRPSVAEAVKAIHAGFCDYRLKSLDCSDLVNPAAWRHEKGARELDELGQADRLACTRRVELHSKGSHAFSRQRLRSGARARPSQAVAPKKTQQVSRRRRPRYGGLRA
jgi:ActR/RegA family two-component response regulator